jgi:hypothetical protein
LADTEKPIAKEPLFSGFKIGQQTLEYKKLIIMCMGHFNSNHIKAIRRELRKLPKDKKLKERARLTDALWDVSFRQKHDTIYHF